MVKKGKGLAQGRPASTRQRGGQNPAFPDAKALSSLSVPTRLPLPSHSLHAGEPPPTLGTSPLTPDKASVPWGPVTGKRAVRMWGGIISSQAGPCPLSQMSGSCEPHGALAWTPQSGARHPMSSLPLALSGTHFPHLNGVGQGGHSLPSYSEKLSLRSLAGAVEQRPLLRAGSSLPFHVRGLGYL